MTLAEYLAIMDKQTMHEDPRSVLDSAFTIFDAEGKGTVDTTELRSVIGNLGEGFSSEEIGQMMLMADIDSDGKMQIEGAAWPGMPAARAARQPPGAPLPNPPPPPMSAGRNACAPRNVASPCLGDPRHRAARPGRAAARAGALLSRSLTAAFSFSCAAARPPCYPDLIKFCVDYK